MVNDSHNLPPVINGAQVPLVVGVTGHRDLVAGEQDLLKSRIRDFFASFQNSFPGLPLQIITPLAEGADRLAAEVADELGIPIVALLPMPRDLYQDDFEGDSLQEFEEWMQLSEIVELPLLPGTRSAELAERGERRDLQYAQLGAYLAAHSHILLAIWDGKISMAPGGTSHVVQFHQHDVIDLIAAGQHRSPIDFAEDESDLVYHIVCSRREHGPPAESLQVGDTCWLTRDDVTPKTPQMPVRYRVVFQRMSEFNVDLASRVVTQRLDHLIPESELASCSAGARDIEKLYQKADRLANHFQKAMTRSLRLTYGFAVMAGLSFIVYADLPDLPYQFDPYVMIYAYLGFIALVILVSMVERRSGWLRKHLDYRVLAEGLRVQFYWSVAGVVMENPSRFSHDSFLKRQDLELGWIRNVMRFAGRRADAGTNPSSRADVELVIDHWVGDGSGGQTQYYFAKSRERVLRNRLTTSLVFMSFVVLIIVALLLAFLQWDSPISNVLVAIMGLLPLIATIRQSYAHRTAERELIAQYGYYYRIFDSANRLLQRAEQLELRREILRALGEAALDESGQWILRQRERPLTVMTN